MRWTRKTIAIAVTGAAFLLGGGAAAAGALTSNSSPSVILAAPAARATPVTPAPTKTVTAPPPPVPTKTVTAPPAPEQTSNWQQPTAPAQPQFTSSIAVVNQYYQDITDRNYSAAWALGGSNLSGGVGYDAWVAGYGTTASITLYSQSDWGSGKVTCYLSALQSDGTTRIYYGTYYVTNGVITSANIAQTS
jgi:hypothetical protein